MPKFNSMTQLDPIIAVKDVEASAAWYCNILGCKSIHGGAEFDVLVNKEQKVLLCLHKWGAHEHASLTDESLGQANGLILYFEPSILRRPMLRLSCWSIL